MRFLGCEILTFKVFRFGDMVAKQFIIFEHKRLIGILFFYFRGGRQDRLHTHAFHSLSIKLFGTYYEGLLRKDGSVYYKKRTSLLKLFDKGTFHSVNDSTGCATLLLQGPWGPRWKEIKDGVETEYAWHRESVDR